MPIGSIWPITTQKVLKTQSVKSVKQHYLGSNHSPNRHIASPLTMKEEESNQKQDELYIFIKKWFLKNEGIIPNFQPESPKSYSKTILGRVCAMKIQVSK